MKFDFKAFIPEGATDKLIQKKSRRFVLGMLSEESGQEDGGVCLKISEI